MAPPSAQHGMSRLKQQQQKQLTAFLWVGTELDCILKVQTFSEVA